MAIRELRIDGDPLLRKTSKPVKKIDARIRAILDDMVETMYEDNGVGLAAPQVGILRRMVVIDVGDGPLKMVNPVIVERSEEQELGIEGCLSIPEYNGTVYRPKKLVVEYTDENGEKQSKEAEELFARCVCHEIDHLDGILFKDRVEMEIDYDNLTPEMIEYLKKNGLLPEAEEQQEVIE